MSGHFHFSNLQNERKRQQQDIDWSHASSGSHTRLCRNQWLFFFLFFFLGTEEYPLLWVGEVGIWEQQTLIPPVKLRDNMGGSKGMTGVKPHGDPQHDTIFTYHLFLSFAFVQKRHPLSTLQS